MESGIRIPGSIGALSWAERKVHQVSITPDGSRRSPPSPLMDTRSAGEALEF